MDGRRKQMKPQRQRRPLNLMTIARNRNNILEAMLFVGRPDSKPLHPPKPLQKCAASANKRFEEIVQEIKRS